MIKHLFQQVLKKCKKKKLYDLALEWVIRHQISTVHSPIQKRL